MPAARRTKVQLMSTYCQGLRDKAPRWVCRLRQTTTSTGVAFATAMRPSIDSDGERLATDIVCCGSKIDLKGTSGAKAIFASIVSHSPRAA
jgi:hypothetical protein